MLLRMTLKKPTKGFWDGGPKQVFEWKIEKYHSNSWHSRIGSYGANHWFTVKTGRTDRQTLGYAKMHLRKTTRAEIASFEYID